MLLVADSSSNSPFDIFSSILLNSNPPRALTNERLVGYNPAHPTNSVTGSAFVEMEIVYRGELYNDINGDGVYEYQYTIVVYKLEDKFNRGIYHARILRDFNSNSTLDRRDIPTSA